MQGDFAIETNRRVLTRIIHTTPTLLYIDVGFVPQKHEKFYSSVDHISAPHCINIILRFEHVAFLTILSRVVRRGKPQHSDEEKQIEGYPHIAEFTVRKTNMMPGIMLYGDVEQGSKLFINQDIAVDLMDTWITWIRRLPSVHTTMPKGWLALNTGLM